MVIGSFHSLCKTINECTGRIHTDRQIIIFVMKLNDWAASLQ